jgi:hypothetical protein
VPSPLSGMSSRLWDGTGRVLGRDAGLNPARFRDVRGHNLASRRFAESTDRACPGSVDGKLLAILHQRQCPPLVSDRGEIPERRISTTRFVPALDVVEDGEPSMGRRREPLAVEKLGRGATSVEAEDPFAAVASGRSRFRVVDLIDLTALLLKHRSEVQGGARRPDLSARRESLREMSCR